MDQKAPTHPALDYPRKEVGPKYLNARLPNINSESPAKTDCREPTSSRTRSVDLRSFCCHNEQQSSFQADFCPAMLPEQETGSRWVKRLKLNASGSCSVGTKSNKLSGKSCHEKEIKPGGKVTKAVNSGLELAAAKFHGGELIAHDRTPAFARNSFSSVNVMKKDQVLLTSQSWIQRLLHNRAASAHKRPEPVVVCEPQGSKLELDDFQKKQFPGIAAMDLMGKAITGFQSCEFQRRDPYVVWNTGVSETT